MHKVDECRMEVALKGHWEQAAGEPVRVEVIGSRVYGFCSTELGALRVFHDWAHMARNRYPEVKRLPTLGWAYSMDAL